MFDKLKSELYKELEECEKKPLSESSLMIIANIVKTIKNLHKIEKYENESEWGEMSHKRGRGYGAKRDAMGRYSKDMYDDGYSEHRYPDGDGRVGGNAYNYSKSNGKDHIINQLGHMMHDADDEERKILEKCMHDLNRV